jgi:hypothetical protein
MEAFLDSLLSGVIMDITAAIRIPNIAITSMSSRRVNPL